MNLEENAQRIREEVVEHLTAPPVRPGKKDLLLMPNHLMLTIHESVGHPTELDRSLGYEANYAGTSYLTPATIGKRIASNHVTIIGDRTSPRALATCGYDDDGVKTTRFTIVDKGIFKTFQTTRDQAHLINEKQSHVFPSRLLGHGAVPENAERLAAGGSGEYDLGRLDRWNQRWSADRRPRKLFH